MAVGLPCSQQSMLRALHLLWALVVGLTFVTSASAQTTETKVVTPKLADWVYRKPPKDVPLKVGVLPPEATNPRPTATSIAALICNRIWLDQGGSYERPFAVTYNSDNRVSSTAFFPGIFALDNYILRSQNDWARLETADGYGKGVDRFLNSAQEAVLLVDHDQERHVGNKFWSLYLQRISTGSCPKLASSQCKRFVAKAELFEFELSSYTSDPLRKIDLGKVHIESLCVGQQYLYHREPFLQPSWTDRFMHWLQRLRKD
jgi:hypothetical protein